MASCMYMKFLGVLLIFFNCYECQLQSPVGSSSNDMSARVQEILEKITANIPASAGGLSFDTILQNGLKSCGESCNMKTKEIITKFANNLQRVFDLMSIPPEACTRIIQSLNDAQARAGDFCNNIPYPPIKSSAQQFLQLLQQQIGNLPSCSSGNIALKMLTDQLKKSPIGKNFNFASDTISGNDIAAILLEHPEFKNIVDKSISEVVQELLRKYSQGYGLDTSETFSNMVGKFGQDAKSRIDGFISYIPKEVFLGLPEISQFTGISGFPGLGQ